MRFRKFPWRVISVLTAACFLVGCGTHYNRTAVPRGQPIVVEGKALILYRGAEKFYLYDVELTEDYIRAKVHEERVGPRPKKRDRVRVHVGPAFTMPESLPASVTIPLTAIEKVEVYTTSVWQTMLFNVGLPVLIIAMLVALKSSCPFIYVFDGEGYEFAGEIFSGATHPPIERHDYLPLPTLRAVGGEYRIKLANEVREIQYTNLAELWVVDHPAGAEVLVDKYGVPHTLAELRSPAEAVTLRGEEVGDVVAAPEGSIYVGEVGEKADRDVEGIVLTFARPPDATAAKLVFQGKNSFWLDYVYGQFAELFGDAYADWFEDQKDASPEELLQWTLEQGIFLAVYVQEGDEWRFVDYYNIVGPMAAKRDVLAFDLPAGTSDDVKVKLEFGPLFWEIDYVGLDFSADAPVRVHKIPLTSAVDEKGGDVTALLRADDDLYYVQPEAGEYALVSFAAPGPAEGSARSTVLHTKGHYEIIRDPQGKPDLKLLYSFKEPGRFIEFSDELFLDYYEAMASRED